MFSNEKKISVIGLGYVGLPLAVAFAKKYNVFGFDINKERVTEIKNGFDRTCEIENDELIKVQKGDLKFRLSVGNDSDELKNSNFFIITVPTPTDKFNRPNLTPMIKASETVAAYLKKGDIVIYESTVYPGVTEEEMAPILENISGLIYNKDFFCGYSPERINPGDKLHTFTNILKITSGSNEFIAEEVDKLYKTVVKAGTFKASSIKVAEAAKVIENSQRDINIAFVNELSKIFNLIGIDTNEVLEAASTKWNFLNFKPGLVGGHCIGVDPYYLAQKAQEVGYNPEIILSGRRLNDSMGKYIAEQIIKLMIKKKLNISDSKVLILGFTFKENCPDVRNTRVIDIYNEIIGYNIEVEVHDPIANINDVKHEYGIEIKNQLPDIKNFSVIILAVSHDQYKDLNIKKSSNQVIFDVKGIFSKEIVDQRL
jgi:UDP-N-acetyl-D-galactosamine dehydrogenase